MENDANQQPEKAQQSAESLPSKAEKVMHNDRPKKSRGSRGQRRNKQQDHNRPKSNPSRPRKRKPRTALDDVRDSFFACGRCSFFFSAMRANLSLATVTEMAELSEQGWLVAGWTPVLRELVERSYGCNIFNDTRHFADSCVECGRMFIVSANESGQLAYFEIQAQRQAPQLPIDRVRKLPAPIVVEQQDEPAEEANEIEAAIEEALLVASETTPTPEASADEPPQTE